MPKSSRAAARPARKASLASTVITIDAFIASLACPRRAELAAVRTIICSAAPGITEEIKWNAPSFRTTESFATVNLRATEQLQIIFHLGAKVRRPLPKIEIADPAGLARWLAPDRALVTVDPATQAEALAEWVREWIRYV